MPAPALPVNPAVISQRVASNPAAPNLAATLIFLTYDQQDYVREALQAALAQRGPPIEILISDDASSDATWDVITATLAGYGGPHQIQLNRNPTNLGVTAHINLCATLARHNILIAAAGDDVSEPDRVQKICAVFAGGNPLLVHSRVTPFPTPPPGAARPYEAAGLLRGLPLVRLALSQGLYIGATGAWHRDIFRQFGPLPERDCYEDLILGFRAALGNRVAFIDAPLVRYRINVGISAQITMPLQGEAWRAVRLKVLRRNRVVQEQRLRDARCFGLPEVSPVIRALQRDLVAQEMRTAFHTLSAGRYLRQFAHRPLLALRISLSERRRLRRAARGAD